MFMPRTVYISDQANIEIYSSCLPLDRVSTQHITSLLIPPGYIAVGHFVHRPGQPHEDEGSPAWNEKERLLARTIQYQWYWLVCGGNPRSYIYLYRSEGIMVTMDFHGLTIHIMILIIKLTLLSPFLRHHDSTRLLGACACGPYLLIQNYVLSFMTSSELPS